MTEIAKYLLTAGLILLAAGAVVWLLGRTGFRGLPGDIHYESENFRFHFPIVTCLALSAAATLFVWVVRWVMRK